MEYQKSTKETLVLGILISLEMVWHHPQTSIVTLMQLSCVMLCTQKANTMSEIKDTE